MAPHAEVSLLSLPAELHMEISNYLDFTSRVAFSYTNKLLSSRIEPKKPKSSEKLPFVRAAEHWPIYENHFGCNKCKRILPRDAFGNRQINKRRKGRPGSLKRFCIDCGFRRRIYRRGQPVAGNGFSLYVCSMCSEVHGTGLYCYFCGTPHRCFEKGFKAAIDAVVEADPGANDGLGVEPGVKKRKKLSRLERSCPRCYLRHAYPRINERSKHYAHFMELLDRRR